jgi:VWFA-related protein
VKKTLALFAGALALQTATAAQQPNFSTRREAVRVDVLVTDRGQPIAGLGPADFDLRDNGVAQNVDLVSYEQIPLNVVLAFDTSDSVTGDRLDHLRTAGEAVLSGLKTGDQAALVTFNHMIAQRAPLSGEFDRVRRALAQPPEPGETSLVDGVYTALTIGESDVGRALVIVFSDGVDTASWLSADMVLETAKRCDAVVYGVSLGGRVRFLRDIAAFTGGSVFDVDSTKNLSAVFLRILDEFRHRYLVSFSPEGVGGSGWHRLEVKIKSRGATIKARPGYLRGEDAR